ncbi:MAG: histidinol-phosphatase [Nitrospiraceae bacterium]
MIFDSNGRLEALFVAMADRLAAQRANPHRIRAYRRAAESVATLKEDVADIAQRGELETISGIGRDLSGKIQEFLSSGTIRSFDELTTPLPKEVATWASLPGLSEPVVGHLYFRLGIRTLDDLEALVHSHLLRTLPGVTVPEDELLAAICAERQKAQPRTDAIP